MTTIVVAAAVVERDGQFFVTRRQAGAHLEGYWEFPGGKCDPGEPLAACLIREIREELTGLEFPPADAELIAVLTQQP